MKICVCFFAQHKHEVLLSVTCDHLSVVSAQKNKPGKYRVRVHYAEVLSYNRNRFDKMPRVFRLKAAKNTI